MRAALCGNPNVGKTTLYNRLTRSDAPIGNWHGVTVDVAEKKMSGTDVVLADLPGTYSLTARSAEECITRDAILFGGYDVIVCVAEVNNLRRNLYLLTQIGECNKRAALVVNMMDEKKGEVNLNLLSERLGIPVIGTSEKYKNPKSELITAIKNAAVPKLDYLTNAAIDARKYKDAATKHGLTPYFVAAKIAERDEYITGLCGVKLKPTEPSVCSDCTACSSCSDCGDVTLPARIRYAYIDRVTSGVAERVNDTRTEKIDKVILGRAALPIFFAVMAAVFVITTAVGKPLSDLIMKGINAATRALSAADITPWIRSLLCDGIIGGVGSVLAFLPQVCILFVLTALLQDSGYMSRVAFISDGFFKKFGLSGRAAFSLVLGLGCSVTGILSTRGEADRNAAKRTAFALPFVPCSARLAVFTALCSYFNLSGLLIAALYVLGFAVSLAALRVMRVVQNSALFKTGSVKRVKRSKRAKKDKIKSEKDGQSVGDTRVEYTVDDSGELLMEMPPYRVPSARRVAKVVLGNVWAFIKRVGTVVLAVGIVMWVLNNFSIGYGFTGGADKSIMSTISGLVAPVFAPLGFGKEAVSALICGIAAKETVISVIASLGGASAVFGSTVSVISFMIFTCLYVPCIATVAALGKEAGAGYAAMSVGVHICIAYGASLLLYQSAVWYNTDVRLFATVWTCIAVALCTLAVYGKCKKVKAKKSNAAIGEQIR